MAKIFWTQIPVETSHLNWEYLLSKISVERSARIERYMQQKDRLLSLTSELLLRAILLQEYAITEDITFSYNEYGKPILQNLPVHFNISHSQNMVVLALDNSSIGVDVEYQKDDIDLSIDRLVFSENEREYLKKRSDKIDAFYRLWTRKESYIKQCGRGFSLPTKTFTLLPEEASFISVTNGNRLFLETHILCDRYYLSCCVEEEETFFYQEVDFEELIASF